MQRKSRTIVLLILLIFLILILNHTRKKEPFLSFAFHMHIIPVVLATYLMGKRAGLVTGLVALVQGIVMANSVLPNVLFLSMFAVGCLLTVKIVLGFDKRLERVSASCDKDYEKAKANYNELLLKDKALLSENKQFEERATQLAELYELSKTMGACLDFEGILKIMRGAVCKTFEFTRGFLILKRDKESKGFDFIHYFDSGEVVNAGIETVQNDAVIEIVTSGKPIQISDDIEKKRFNLPPKVDSFIGVPLILSGVMVGVTGLENFTLRHRGMYGKQVSPGEIMGVFSIFTAQFVLQMQKVTLYEEVERLSIIDGLTQTALRRYFLQRFEEELKRSRHHSLPLSALMIDIDHFKSYNDRYGHLVGDAVLEEIAKILIDGVRDVDIVSRYGGEEFCIMLPDTDKEGAYKVAERIRWLVENSHFKTYDEETSVTISIGVSSFPVDADGVEKLIDNADSALLKAKEAGRNRVCKY